ncbi:MAG: chorismate lyase [Gallionella sp.]|nr:chorismate lyase [Gallionella sp.]
MRDCGSLTQRIQHRCSRFAADKVRTGLARIAPDESALLGIAPQQLAYSREVFLYADDKPVVFAHPLVERKPLHYKALRNTLPLYQRASTVLSGLPPRLWARRSLFYLHDAPLLVTEVFLPGILLLTNPASNFA